MDVTENVAGLEPGLYAVNGAPGTEHRHEGVELEQRDLADDRAAQVRHNSGTPERALGRGVDLRDEDAMNMAENADDPLLNEQSGRDRRGKPMRALGRLQPTHAIEPLTPLVILDTLRVPPPQGRVAGEIHAVRPPSVHANTWARTVGSRRHEP